MDNAYLAVIAWDPVPTELLTTDQVQAQRRALLYLQTLKGIGAAQLLCDPDIFSRQDNEEISKKKVPTCRELISQALKRGPAYYYGFMNADIILGPHFLSDLSRCRAVGNDIVLLHRTDVDSLSEVDSIVKSPHAAQIEIGKKVNPKNSTDGIFMTREAAGEFLEHFPSFVIAEPWWDTAAIYWARQSRFSVHSMAENQALHVKHPQGWSFRNKGARRAHELYVELMQNWPLS